MLKQKSYFRLITYLLSITIILTACHSFYEIPLENYKNIDTMNDIKIVYKNGKEFVVEKDDTTNINFQDSTLVIKKGVDTQFVKMSDVDKLKENRSNWVGTITLAIVITTGLLVWFVSLNPFKM